MYGISAVGLLGDFHFYSIITRIKTLEVALSALIHVEGFHFYSIITRIKTRQCLP